MTLSAILVPLNGGASGRVALDAAFTLGRAFDALVEAFHVELDPASSLPPMSDAAAGIAIGEILSGLKESAEERKAAARGQFDAACIDAGLSDIPSADAHQAGGFEVCWRSIVGREDDEVARRARCFDITVLPQPDPGLASTDSVALEAALMDSARPILVVPNAGMAAAPNTAVIAWSNTREASVALAAALPILKSAQVVHAYTIGEDDDSAFADSMTYLRHHGVNVEAQRLLPDYRPIGEQILDQCRSDGAGILIMGGYSHSRLRETVFGGVTRSILETADIPVLMAH